MSEFRSQCGCEIHVAQWTSKRKVASVKHCPLHGAAKEILTALQVAVNTVECASVDVSTGEELPWYRMARKAISKAEGR